MHAQVFYLHPELAMNPGEVLNGKARIHDNLLSAHKCLLGTISVAPNKGNRRDLDINLSYDFKGKAGSASDNQDYKMR